MKKQIFSSILFIVFILGFAVLGFTYFSVQEQEQTLTDDLQRRSILFADSLRESVTAPLNSGNASQVQRIIANSLKNERIQAIVVYDNKGTIVASSSALISNASQLSTVATTAMDQNDSNTEVLRDSKNTRLYTLAIPLHQGDNVSGSLEVIYNASYIDTELLTLWKNALFRFLLYALLITIGLFLIIEWVISKPFVKLLETIRSMKSGAKVSDRQFTKHHMFRPLFEEFSDMRQSIIEAQTAATYEAKLRLEKLDSPWTVERLKEFTKEALKARSLYVVSNREPYIHTKNDGKIQVVQPASGMVTALDPLMKACGGTWIAHGSGNADREVVDKNDTVTVPPSDPKYNLKRVWLTSEEEKGYYYGFSNDGLWPLCHSAFVEPIFREPDWEEYKRVNEKFANVILEEIKKVKNPIIFIQDYHFTLLPQLIKQGRPDVVIGLFWHIPWPNSESFKICPWRKEILTGMLGADLLAFHTQLHCNNFIDTVGKELEALIDLEQFAVIKNEHISYIKPFPIGIAFSDEVSESTTNDLSLKERDKILRDMGITPTEFIGVGVDRMDYTKGIIERFRAIERFLERNPSYVKKFTFLQVAPPTRSNVVSYQQFASDVALELKRINSRFKKNNWVPIVLINDHLNRDQVTNMYKVGNFCLVTSLHDGMNLVAKEYLASRSDEKGALILSQFAGASRELKDALIINPYDIDQTANAIATALTMPIAEQTKRMKRLRELVKNNNVYRWSAEILKTMVGVEV